MLNTFKLTNVDLNPDADLTTDTLLSHFRSAELHDRHVRSAELHDQYCESSQIYVFGDSLSDIGNTFDLTQKALGEGLPPASPYFAGRFSNGPVWVEYLARFLKVPSSRHTNFAASGANTGSTNTFIPNNPYNLPGLQQQIEQFIASTRGSQADPEAVYIVWAGANDYMSGGITDPNAPVENLLNAIRSLLNVDAKQIMAVNLPDLGKLPASRGDSQVVSALDALTQAHNAALATSLHALQDSVSSNIKITLFDVNLLFKQMFAEPAEFGFTNVADTEMEKLAQFQGYTDTFFFWDTIHPTTFAHLTLAKAAIATLSPASTASTA
jgi:phospholipase/lecithinase/hemolysin